ncbi:hypothetical protein [Niveibacterium sp. COAC-50]|uniref:hypothetical protein n=1 Tax=Niveibacterium sp. COAC-50 TaxID=2729384 RepID=UPI0015560E30|nr:hypothetical protein [Niveibacterium sp. COAC-50]
MTRTNEPNCLRLEMRSVAALLAPDDSPFAGPALHADVAERLLDEADSKRGNVPLRIEFVVDEDRPGDVQRVVKALRRHFEDEALAATRDLSRVMRSGRIATVIGLLVVAILLGFANTIDPDSTSRFARAVRESLTIFAWVAMWRPAELLLYDHMPIRRRRALSLRLAAAPVSLIARDGTTVA